MKKKNIAQVFEVPTELFSHIAGFEDATILCRHPNTMERFLLMDSHKDLVKGNEISDLFYLVIISALVQSIDGVKYEDGTEATIRRSGRYKTISLMDGDIIEELRAAGSLYMIGNYIVNQLFVTEEQKKS